MKMQSQTIITGVSTTVVFLKLSGRYTNIYYIILYAFFAYLKCLVNDFENIIPSFSCTISFFSCSLSDAINFNSMFFYYTPFKSLNLRIALEKGRH